MNYHHIDHAGVEKSGLLQSPFKAAKTSLIDIEDFPSIKTLKFYFKSLLYIGSILTPSIKAVKKCNRLYNPCDIGRQFYLPNKQCILKWLTCNLINFFSENALFWKICCFSKFGFHQRWCHYYWCFLSEKHEDNTINFKLAHTTSYSMVESFYKAKNSIPLDTLKCF